MELIDKLLPPVDVAYTGPQAALYFNYLLVAWNLSRTGIHMFSDESGAVHGPGLDISGKQGLDIISLIAQFGVATMIFFLVQLAVVIRYPFLTPFLLFLSVIEHWTRFAMGKYKPLGSATNRPPPGAKLTFFFMAASPVFFLISLMESGTEIGSQ